MLKLTKMKQTYQVMKATTTLRLLILMQDMMMPNPMIKNPSLLNSVVSTPFLALSLDS